MNQWRPRTEESLLIVLPPPPSRVAEILVRWLSEFDKWECKVQRVLPADDWVRFRNFHNPLHAYEWIRNGALRGFCSILHSRAEWLDAIRSKASPATDSADKLPLRIVG